MVLPVKVSAQQTTHLVHTVDISGVGARLGGLRTVLVAGTTVELQRGSRKAKFIIKWVHQLAANEIQIGVESVEPQDNFWGVDLSQQDKQSRADMDALMTLLSRSAKSPS